MRCSNPEQHQEEGTREEKLEKGLKEELQMRGDVGSKGTGSWESGRFRAQHRRSLSRGAQS